MSQDLHNSNLLGRLFYVVANFPGLRVEFGHGKPFRGAKDYPLLKLSFSIEDCGVTSIDVIEDLRSIIQPTGNYADYRFESPFIKLKLWL